MDIRKSVSLNRDKADVERRKKEYSHHPLNSHGIPFSCGWKWMYPVAPSTLEEDYAYHTLWYEFPVLKTLALEEFSRRSKINAVPFKYRSFSANEALTWINEGITPNKAADWDFWGYGFKQASARKNTLKYGYLTYIYDCLIGDIVSPSYFMKYCAAYLSGRDPELFTPDSLHHELTTISREFKANKAAQRYELLKWIESAKDEVVSWTPSMWHLYVRYSSVFDGPDIGVEWMNTLQCKEMRTKRPPNKEELSSYQAASVTPQEALKWHLTVGSSFGIDLVRDGVPFDWALRMATPQN